MNFSFENELLPATTPYLLWKSWKRREDTERLSAVMSQDDEEALTALLSYFSETLPLEISHHAHTLLQHSSYKIRAASIILLSYNPEFVTNDDLRQLFKDNNRYVRMGALHAFSRCPDLWEELIEDLACLFSDIDLNIQYFSMNIAARVKNPFFVKPLISGLKNDALNQRVSIFGQRCNTLEQITGMNFDSEPEWREGQCWYSERSTETRLGIAQKWIEWQKKDSLILD